MIDRIAFSLIACFIAATVAASAQEPAIAPPPGAKLHQFVNSEGASKPAESRQSPEVVPSPAARGATRGSLPSEPGNPALPSTTDPALSDPQTRAKYFESLQSYY